MPGLDPKKLPTGAPAVPSPFPVRDAEAEPPDPYRVKGPGYSNKVQSVERRVKGLIDENSPLMRQAATQGRQLAGRRGLLNSSIAAGAAQDAVLGRAIPIASQSAAQAAEANRQRQAFLQERALTREAQGASDQITREGFGLQRDLQSNQIGSTERIAEMSISADLQRAGAATVAAMEATYSQMFSALASNPEIPAAVRDQYLAHAGAIRDSSMNLVDRLYGLNLEWSNTPTPTLPRQTSTAPPRTSGSGQASTRSSGSGGSEGTSSGERSERGREFTNNNREARNDWSNYL